MAAELYHTLLKRLPEFVTDLSNFRSLWMEEDAVLTESESQLDSGKVTIEERPDMDLAIVRVVESMLAQKVHRFSESQLVACHHFAVHNRTRRSRLIYVQGNNVEFQYRYESWVRMTTSRPGLRADLTPLAEELNREEGDGANWQFDGVDRITPRLFRKGNSPNRLSADEVIRRIEQHLVSAPPAWNPYV